MFKFDIAICLDKWIKTFLENHIKQPVYGLGRICVQRVRPGVSKNLQKHSPKGQLDTLCYRIDNPVSVTKFVVNLRS